MKITFGLLVALMNAHRTTVATRVEVLAKDFDIGSSLQARGHATDHQSHMDASVHFKKDKVKDSANMDTQKVSIDSEKAEEVIEDRSEMNELTAMTEDAANMDTANMDTHAERTPAPTNIDSEKAQEVIEDRSDMNELTEDRSEDRSEVIEDRSEVTEDRSEVIEDRSEDRSEVIEDRSEVIEDRSEDGLQCPTQQGIVAPKDQCKVESYYEGVELTNAQALHDKITGQNALIYSNHYPEGHAKHSCADIWNALEFLDENADDSTMVDLIYSKFPTKKDSRVEQGFWNREHLWPKSYGVSCKVAERRWEAKRGKGVKCKNKKTYVEDNGGFTDVHHLFASNSAVNSDRSSEYFEACTPETCSYDHHEDDGYTAEDQDAGESLDDKTFWQPPAKSRGVVARAMFYMALRYNGDEENTYDLKLTDTPRYCQDAIGKLSVLKQWHNDFKVTEAERTRNDKACWVQGNRNPFVDHPELVDILFGEDASSKLVSTDTTPCPYDSPRAHICNPDEEPIDKCLDATKPEPRPKL